MREFRVVPGLRILLLFLLPSWACSGEPTCSPPCGTTSADPPAVVDPLTLGDGSGYPGISWTRVSDPRTLGWNRDRLRTAEAMAASMGSDALMVVDRGIVVLEYGATDKNYVVQSCRKSFLSALYGIFVENGTIDMESTLEELGMDDLHPLTSEEKQATLEDLIRARSGVYHEAAAEAPSMKENRPERGSHPPGTFWYYNNWDFNVLGTVFIQLTGEDIFQSLYHHFAVPLQMQEFLPANGRYQYEDISLHPAYHFDMSARDMARFGLLFLREGLWRDQQILTPEWVQRSTRAYSDTGGDLDYGYMWWVGVPGAWSGHTLYAARGGSGQAIYVVPEMELVITHKVDYNSWAGDWNGIHALVRQILGAR